MEKAAGTNSSFYFSWKKSNESQMTWGWLNDDRNILFGWIISLMTHEPFTVLIMLYHQRLIIMNILWLLVISPSPRCEQEFGRERAQHWQRHKQFFYLLLCKQAYNCVNRHALMGVWISAGRQTRETGGAPLKAAEERWRWNVWEWREPAQSKACLFETTAWAQRHSGSI